MTSDRKKTPLRDLTTYGDGRAVRLDDCNYSADVDIHVTLCVDCGRPFEGADIARMVCEWVAADLPVGRSSVPRPSGSSAATSGCRAVRRWINIRR